MFQAGAAAVGRVCVAVGMAECLDAAAQPLSTNPRKILDDNNCWSETSSDDDNISPAAKSSLLTTNNHQPLDSSFDFNGRFNLDELVVMNGGDDSEDDEDSRRGNGFVWAKREEEAMVEVDFSGMNIMNKKREEEVQQQKCGSRAQTMLRWFGCWRCLRSKLLSLFRALGEATRRRAAVCVARLERNASRLCH